MHIKILSAALLMAVAMLACQQNPSQSATKTPENTATASTETLPWATNLDLVCEMTVKQDTKDTLHYEGKIYGFCNPYCKDEFKANPGKYVGN